MKRTIIHVFLSFQFSQMASSTPRSSALTELEEHLEQRLLDKLRGQKEFTAPKLSSKSYQVQTEINCKVLNLLLKAPQEGPVKEAMEILKDRNALLEAADRDPKVFELAETAEKIKNLSGSTGDSSLNGLLLASSLLRDNPTSRKRKMQPYPPFQQRGGGAAFPPSRNSYGNNEVARALNDLRSSIENRPGPSGVGRTQRPKGLICYRCWQYGHRAEQCQLNGRSTNQW